MTKKLLLILVLVVLIAGTSFAQTSFRQMPKNTVTVDFGPTIMGAAIGGIGNLISEPGLSSSGFGLAAQYERQLQKQWTIAGRLAYLGGGIGIAMEEDNVKATAETKFSSFSFEGHSRYYPMGDMFFLDTMLGFATLSSRLSGEGIGTNDDGSKDKVSLSINATRPFIKLGAKIGWRIDFGKQGGFIFEPSFGYYSGIGLGDTLGKKLWNDNRRKNYDIDIDVSEFDVMFTTLENVIFIGGPRITLACGWRF